MQDARSKSGRADVFRTNHPRGFTILFAAIVSSLLLAVGFTIFDITFKEAEFASVVRNSNYAFYAADAGYECASYWDRRAPPSEGLFQSPTVFATSTNSFEASSPSGIACAGTADITQPSPPLPIPFLEDPNDTQPSPLHCPNGSHWCIVADAADATTTFMVTFSSQTYCAIVQVVYNHLNAVYISRGYNTCDASDPSRVERVLETN